MNPIANPDQFAAEADVRAMLEHEQVRKARAMVARMFREGYGDQTPAEAEPSFDAAMDEFLGNYLFKAAASDGQHPRFVRNFMQPYRWNGQDVPGSRMGGDNPDNCYRLAGVEHGGRYRVTARPLGDEPSNTSFTLTANYGTTVTVGTIESHQATREPDGSFVITIDAEPANGRSNHLTTAPGVKFLFVRDTMGDWARQTPFHLTIERLGPPMSAPVSVDEMAARAAHRVIEDVPLYYWYQRRYTSHRPNKILAQPHAAIGALVSQMAGRAYVRLEEDEAAVIDIHPAGAAYAAVQLTDWWWRTIAPGERTSSLTADQSHVDADGRIRWVVARRDPGVANWLDTGGLATVLMVLRWQRLPPNPQVSEIGLKVIKLDQLREVLRPETRWFGAQEREAQLAARRAAYARRLQVES